MTDQNQSTSPEMPIKRRKKGYLHARKVRSVAFFAITLCIIVSVVACILAIWDFAQKDVLWRTVATCAVIAAGFAMFSILNTAIGHNEEE
jgi:uncharacterized membrane protein YbhN (UPF0104 family)